MTASISERAQLDKAYVQSRVIESSLQHLASTLESVAPDLSGDVTAYAWRFEEYVRRLGDACDRVDDATL